MNKLLNYLFTWRNNKNENVIKTIQSVIKNKKNHTKKSSYYAYNQNNVLKIIKMV